MLTSLLDIAVNRQGYLGRREFLANLAGGATAGALTLGWRDMLVAQAAELRKKGKSIILLWMDGGPSQFDTFNPKVGSPNQGPARAISTNVAGVEFADFWPQTAMMMDKLAVVRSMRTPEAEHDRAITHVRTGYRPTPALRYPTFGSLVARAREDLDFDLPAFVRIGKPRIKTRDVDAGVLGVTYSSFNVDQAGTLPPNVRPIVAAETLRRRLALADRFDSQFAAAGAAKEVADKKSIYDRTARFVLSPRLETFDLEREPAVLRDAYGRTNFGQGCLLARRLVEQGVSFVEVISTGDRNDAGWDTHGNGFRDTPYLAAEVDPAYSTLIQDLEQRGMLNDTLVVWMGEFGRTPKIKADGGRDHYSKGWPVVFAGGGVRGGQVIGATDADGIDVTDRAIDVADLCLTLCHIMGMKPDDEYRTSDNRPIKLIEGGELIHELFA
ncbi:MAG: DUF1501 domain-containing protein [Candidatus Saccharimonas sp.]|nr:DUF1501 domain-containing protein [Planctomycetaceae bacterium]